jgi:hypothetical protein
MNAFIFRLIFWGFIIAMGSQTGFGIFDMRDKMRTLDLEQVSEPWPTLKPAPYVDHSVNPYEQKKTSVSLGKILGL